MDKIIGFGLVGLAALTLILVTVSDHLYVG
jgi:hypothetical protein